MIKYILNIINSFMDIRAISRSAYFDVKWYKKYFLKEYKEKVSFQKHYYKKGYAQGLNPNRYFQSNEYFSLNSNINNVQCCPLSHYLRVGRALGYTYNRHLDLDIYSDVAVAQCEKIKADNLLRACIIIHMYPEVSFEYVEKYIRNIPKNVDIHILSDTAEKLNKFGNACRNISKCTVYLHQVYNVGRDTSALLVGAKNIVCQYDCFCFIHVKQSLQCDYGDSWREYLFHHLLGSREGIHCVLELFSRNAEIGLVYPPVYPCHMFSDLWDDAGNKEGVERLMNRKFGWKYRITVEDKFPVGGMFWARTNAVIPLFNISWNYMDFHCDDTPDGALRHYIERAWPLVARMTGYTIQEMLQRTPQNFSSYLARNGVVYYVSECWDNQAEHDVRLLSIDFARVYVLCYTGVDGSSNVQKITGTFLFSMPSNVVFRDISASSRICAWLEALCMEETSSFDVVVCLHDGARILRSSLLAALNRIGKSKIDFTYSDIRRSTYSENGIPRSDLMIFNKNVVTSGVLCELRNMIRIFPNVTLPQVERALAELLSHNNFYVKNITEMHHVKVNDCSLHQYPLAYVLCGSPIYLKESMIILGHHWNRFEKILNKLF